MLEFLSLFFNGDTNEHKLLEGIIKVSIFGSRRVVKVESNSEEFAFLHRLNISNHLLAEAKPRRKLALRA